MNIIKDLHRKLPFKVSAPLERMRVSQKFGANALPEYKTKFGLAGHNGLDLSCPVGTDIFACFDGEVHQFLGDSGYGINIQLQSNTFSVEGSSLRIQAIYGHLSEFVTVHKKQVKRGDLIAKSGDTGFSTGPHLHWGIKPQYLTNDAVLSDYNNGYHGAVDPTPFLEKNPEITPAMERYGQKRTWFNFGREKALAFSPITRRVLGRLPTNVEINAVIYGGWSWPELLDPTLFIFWQQLTRDEYEEKKSRFFHGLSKSIWE